MDGNQISATSRVDSQTKLHRGFHGRMKRASSSYVTGNSTQLRAHKRILYMRCGDVLLHDGARLLLAGPQVRLTALYCDQTAAKLRLVDQLRVAKWGYFAPRRLLVKRTGILYEYKSRYFPLLSTRDKTRKEAQGL